MKENKGLIGAVIVLIIIIVGMFIFTYLQSVEVQNSDGGLSLDNRSATGYANISSIDAVQYFSDGTHTLVGEIEFQTPCDLLSWDTVIAESYPEQVTINFSVSNHAETCAQVVANQPFQIIFNASKEATIRVRLEGRSVDLNLTGGHTDEEVSEFKPIGTR